MRPLAEKVGPMSTEQDGISFRPLISTDVSVVPLSRQGEPAAIRQRIVDLGASDMLAFDGAQHVGQLQFRWETLRLSPFLEDAGYECQQLFRGRKVLGLA